MQYNRNFPCAVCGNYPTYDTATKTIECLCGTCETIDGKLIPKSELDHFWVVAPAYSQCGMTK